MSNRAQNSLSLHNSICCVFPGTSPRRMNIYICMPSQLNTRDTEHKACYQEILKQKHRILGEKYKPQRTASPTSLQRRKTKLRAHILTNINQLLVKRRPWAGPPEPFPGKLLYPLKKDTEFQGYEDDEWAGVTLQGTKSRNEWVWSWQSTINTGCKSKIPTNMTAHTYRVSHQLLLLPATVQEQVCKTHATFILNYSQTALAF